MNDLFSLLLTFGPPLLIVLLANLAERARERSSIVQVVPTLVNATPDAGSLPDAPTAPVQQALPDTLPSSLTDIYPDEPVQVAPVGMEPYVPTAAQVTATPASDGTVWAVLAYALMLFYLVTFLVASGFAAIMPFVLSQNDANIQSLLAGSPFIERFNWTFLAWATALTCIFGMIVMLRPVRRLIARIIPIDPLSTVHSVALSLVSLVVLQMVFTAGVGIDVLADMVAEGGDAAAGAMTITGAWMQAALFVAMGFFGVGWLIRRGFHATRIRLAIVMPTLSQTLVAVGLAFLMVGVVIALEMVSNAVGWGFDEDVGRLSEQLLGGLILTVPGILTMGLSAGIGEETLMRGALQPRFGLVLTSVIFALLHGNYGLTLSTLAVLIVGLTLGILRNRTNTTAAMIMHATYNCILGFLPFLWQQ